LVKRKFILYANYTFFERKCDSFWQFYYRGLYTIYIIFVWKFPFTVLCLLFFVHTSIIYLITIKLIVILCIAEIMWWHKENILYRFLEEENGAKKCFFLDRHKILKVDYFENGYGDLVKKRLILFYFEMGNIISKNKKNWWRGYIYQGTTLNHTVSL